MGTLLIITTYSVRYRVPLPSVISCAHQSSVWFCSPGSLYPVFSPLLSCKIVNWRSVIIFHSMRWHTWTYISCAVATKLNLLPIFVECSYRCFESVSSIGLFLSGFEYNCTVCTWSTPVSPYTVVPHCVHQYLHVHVLYGPSCTVAFALFSWVWTTLWDALCINTWHASVSRQYYITSTVWLLLCCLCLTLRP